VTHGTQAKEKIQGSLSFYGKLFQKSCALSWPEVTAEAARYVAPLEKLAPRHVEEIRGIAAGAGVDFLDVLALNVRTEINFGLFTDAARQLDIPNDGCTALAWLVPAGEQQQPPEPPQSWLSQNWDWVAEQGENLIVCHISQPGTELPDLAMVTEAGIIGKIGLNARGVGCCLNAIRCRGVDPAKLPIHFALRAVLESASREAAAARIEALGVAGSGHILVADPTGAVGLECTSRWVKRLAAGADGRLCHTNHLVLPHPDVDEPPWLADSPRRLARIEALTAGMAPPADTATLFALFKDTDGLPTAINRHYAAGVGNSTVTVFNIIMDLTNRRAEVKFGQPTNYKAEAVLSF
jgi:isopenicillin-N N-acyltransferase like protein